MGRSQTATTRARISNALLEDLTGKSFGFWKVLRKSPRKFSHPYWICQCSCGTVKEVTASNLRSESSTSCGCGKYKNGGHSRLRPFESLFRKVMKYARGKELNWGPSALAYEEFLEFTSQPSCFYCGDALVWNPYNGAYARYVSQQYNLDRKDSTKGYCKENCVVCCKTCNFGKGNRYTFEEWSCMTYALRCLRKEQNANTRTVGA